MDFIIDANRGMAQRDCWSMVSWEIWKALFTNVNTSVLARSPHQVADDPCRLERRGLFHDTADFRNRYFADCRGPLLTFVMTYELIQMLIDRNNLHDVDTWMFFKWVFKTFVAVMILTRSLAHCAGRI